MKIGIDIGGSHIAVGLINDRAQIVQKEEMDLIVANGKMEEVIMQTIVEDVRKILKQNQLHQEDIEGIGIASPGTVVEGEIVRAGNLGLENFRIVEELNQYFTIPIQLTNDAKCAGIAVKKYGELQEYDNCIFLTIGTGIGGAVFWNGELLKPKKYPGFEMGHMVIQKENGKACKCGRNGCFEQYCSITALKKAIREEYKLKEMTGKQLYEWMQERTKEEKMKKIVEHYLNDVAIGLANLINIFEPEAIGIGGSFAYYETMFFPVLEEKLKHLLYNQEMPKIIFTKIKNDAGMLGAI